jgi:hypothetical protein
MPYIGVSPFNGVRRKHTYTATASQTSFSGAGAEGITLSYKDSTFVDVFQNGVKLGEADYTSTSGTAIVLAQGASLNDIVEVVVYDVFSVADTVSKADGGTFDGNVTMGGTLAVTGETTLATHLNMGDSDKIKLGASGDLEVYHDGSNSFVDDTGTGSLFLRGESQVIIGNMTGEQAAVFNDDGAVTLNHDNTKKFETTSSGVTVTGSITSEGGDNLFRNSSGSSIVSIIAGTSNSSILKLGDTADFDVGQIEYNHSSNYLAIKTNDTERFRIDDNGHVTMPSQPAFQAQPTSDQNNVTGDATTFSAVNIAFTEIFDQNDDFNHDDGTNRGKFTAPVTGRYLLGISCFFSGVTSASTSGVVAIATSNRTYNRNLNPFNVANVGVNGNYNFCILADMDANDTANFSLYVNGNGSKVVDLAASQTTFYGHLAC